MYYILQVKSIETAYEFTLEYRNESITVKNENEDCIVTEGTKVVVYGYIATHEDKKILKMDKMEKIDSVF